MDLPTYTSIWRIEKRLYKLYDFRLPMPVPVGQIAVFAAITVPYVIILTVLGLPFSHTLFWLYVLPPAVLTWLATRPVLESKRLPELVISQVRYLGEPATWCRLSPLAEQDEIAVVGRVWRRAEQEQEAEVPAAVPDRQNVPAKKAVPAIAQPASAPAAAAVPARAVRAAAIPATARPATARPGTAGARGPAQATVRGTAGPAPAVSRPRQAGRPAPAGPPVQPRPAVPPGQRMPAPPPAALSRPAAFGQPAPAAAAAPADPARLRGQGAPAGPDTPGAAVAQPVSLAQSPPAVAPAPPAAAPQRDQAQHDQAGRPGQAGPTSRPVWPGRPGPSATGWPVARAAPPTVAGPAAAQDLPVTAPPAAAPPAAAPPAAAPTQARPLEIAHDERRAQPSPPVSSAAPATPPADPGQATDPAPARPAPPPAAVPVPAQATGPERPTVTGPERTAAFATSPAAAATPEAPTRAAPAVPGPPAEVAAQAPGGVPRPAAPPVVVVRGSAGARPAAVERALGAPGQPGAGASWRERVRVVPGGQGPGRPDMERRDRARALLPIRGSRLIVLLGCTVGAGQSVTTLMLADVLASLRTEPVAALDLNPGPASLTELAGTAPAVTTRGLLAGQPPVSAPGQGALNFIAHDPAAGGRADLSDAEYVRLIRVLGSRYPITLADPGAAAVARVLAAADQLVLVAPASADAARALTMTMEWLDGHGYGDLGSTSIAVINGVSKRSITHVEQAELVVRGRCRAIVRVPWDDHLGAPPAGPGRADPGWASRFGQLRPPVQHAYTALAGVLVSALAVAPARSRGAAR
ncbi:MAG TPA: TcpE family conjugal transfer membrane protein [Streptosporangiaceae bacterium]|nr:TcpE family conjugal transfer membrane protein [Streptosporangiaceae bacterium]